MTEDDVRQLLRELGEEAPPADSLVRVRQQVAERTAAGRVWWWPALATAVAAVCLLLVVLLKPQPQPRTPAPPPVIAVVEPPAAPVKPAPPPSPSRAARKPAKRDGLVIRMETNDPDVVILLIADDSE